MRVLIFLIFLFTGLPFFSGAQSIGNISIPDTSILPAKSLLQRLVISGNKKTKDYIILRELGLQEGDSLESKNLRGVIDDAQKRVYNLNLFTHVDITIIYLDSIGMQAEVHVNERWFIYPMPQFQLVDRNYNEWVKVYNADLNRVIYGIKFLHSNFTGRKDELRLYVLNGYARNISFSYQAPYSNNKLDEGFTAKGSYTQSREFAYKNSYENKLMQYNRTGFVKYSINAGGSYQKRLSAYRRESIGANFYYSRVEDSVATAAYNPDYFGNGSTSRFYPELYFTHRYINTDNNNYPLKGTAYMYNATKYGWGFGKNSGNVTFTAGFNKYFALNENWFYRMETSGLIRFPFQQPYIFMRAMGYGEFLLRGHEYYVVDGAAAALVKNTVSRRLFSFNIPMPFKIRSVPTLPFTIFAKAYGDAGYAYRKDGNLFQLNNKLIYTGGVGLDVLALYDMTLRIEYSWNQLGEKGLFLHSKATIF